MVLSFGSVFKKTETQGSVLTPRKYSDFLNILVQKGYLTPNQIKSISEEGARLQKNEEEILEEKGLVPDERMALAYSLFYNIPIIHVPEKLIPPSILSLIPRETAEKLGIIPFDTEDNHLKIGVVNPFKLTQNKPAIDQLLARKWTPAGFLPSYYIIENSDFRRVLVQYEGTSLEPFKKKAFSPITLAGLQIPWEVISRLPQAVAEKYNIIVFGLIPDKLIKIAVVDPADPKVLEILDFIEKRTGLLVEKYVTTREDLSSVLPIYQNPPPPKPQVLETPKPETEEEKPQKPSFVVEKVSTPTPEEMEASLLKKDITDLKELEEIIKGGHVPKIVAAIFNFACQKGATDIHIQPYEKDLLIRYRVDGMLRDITHIPKDEQAAVISRVKILSKLKIDETRIPQDGRFDLNFHGRSVDIRVSTLPTSFGEKAVLRLLDKSFGILTLEQLGLQSKGFKDLIAEIEKPYGVILATGPTGCGKTTTLYAVLNRVKNPTVNIITLEDPVEYRIDGVNQSQIKPEIGYSFATGLRSILRQDPNIIMVGEVRDAETAQMVTHAALTGHLVLTTLHTNEAASALPRLINMGVEPFLITSALNAIIAQRLLRKVCQKCQEEIRLGEAVVAEIEKEIMKMPKGILESLNIKRPFPFRKGKGCDECEKGYKGRIGIFEVLVVSPAIEDLAVRRRPASEMQKKAEEEGMITMRQDGILKVIQGLTTYDEVLRVISTE